MMLQAVMKSNPGSDYIYVVDTRPKVSACFRYLEILKKKRPPASGGFEISFHLSTVARALKPGFLVGRRKIQRLLFVPAVRP